MGEVRRRRRRPQPGIDPDEQQPQPGSDEIGNGGIAEALQLGPGESHGGGRYAVDLGAILRSPRENSRPDRSVRRIAPRWTRRATSGRVGRRPLGELVAGGEAERDELAELFVAE